MFLVIADYAISDYDEAMDVKIMTAAGRKSDTSTADLNRREHIWSVSTIQEARRIKREVGRVNGVSCCLREK